MCVKRIVRRYPESGLDRFGPWASRNDSVLVLRRTNLRPLSRLDVNPALDHFVPTKMVRFHPTEKPWITAHIKELIKKRQQAHRYPKLTEYRCCVT